MDKRLSYHYDCGHVCRNTRDLWCDVYECYRTTVQIYVNKIDYTRVAISMEEPLKRHGRLGGCILLINRVKHPKKIPTTAP